MATYNNTPFALRSRGPLPGLFTTQQNGVEYAQPTPIRPADAPVVPSIERPASPEPIEREWTPEPVNRAELERTPSPFIKKEPADKNTYSKFVVPDDSDEYDPRRSTRIAAQAKPSAPYDPARPVPQRSTRFDRIPSSKDGKTFEPPTICFTDQYRDQQFVHVLRCHGEIETGKPHACGSNCATVVPGDKTLFNMWPLDCTHDACVEAREKRHASVFMPKKRARTTTPAIGRQPTRARPSADGMRRSSRLKTSEDYDAKTAELNEQVASDPAFAQLVASTDDAQTRRKSKRHPGYAYTKEMREDADAEHLLKITGGLDLSFDDKPMLKREMKNLHVDGTEKLSGIGGTFGLKRKAEDDAAAFNAHDKGVGADLERGPKARPWSYANSWNAKPGKKAIRNEEAGMFSIPETTYEAMVEEENGVIVEREDTFRHRLPRLAGVVNTDAEDGDGNAGYQTVEARHVCEVAGDGQLEECTDCHHHFHAVCAGDPSVYTHLETTEDHLYHWICDGEDCEKRLTYSGVRYKCMNAACRNFDYCLDCFQKRSGQHVLQMAEKGEDPAAHRFVAVRGEFDEAVKAIEDAQDSELTCSECKDRQHAQKLADQMLSKKTLGLGELRTKLHKQRKAENKAFKDAGVYTAVKERIEAEKKSGISKPRKTSSRASNRLAGSGLGSKRSGGFKLKLTPKLTPKKLDHLTSLKLTEDSPVVIAAKAQLETIPEEQDVEMGDGEDEKLGGAEDWYDPELFGEE